VRNKTDHPVLVLDSGDLFFQEVSAAADRKRALAKARLLARAYGKLRADAVNVGDLDLMEGIDFLKEAVQKGVPLISANLLEASTQRPIFQPYVIREVSGIRIAVMGLIRSEISPDIRNSLGGAAKIRDPVETAKELLPVLQAKADVVILLSDLGVQMDRKAARTLRGIHFILGAHDGRYIKWPYQEGETYIVQSYKKGMYTGRLDLKIQNPGTAFQDEDRTRRLRQQLGDLNRRLEALKRAQQRRPTETLKRTIDRIQRQKAQLQSELEAGNMPHSSANRFRWSLHPLVLSLPEDETVRSWIQKSGIRKD